MTLLFALIVPAIFHSFATTNNTHDATVLHDKDQAVAFTGEEFSHVFQNVLFYVFIIILSISFFGILIGYFWRPPNNNSIIINNNDHHRDSLREIKSK